VQGERYPEKLMKMVGRWAAKDDKAQEWSVRIGILGSGLVGGKLGHDLRASWT